jgi:hypothetical protein
LRWLRAKHDEDDPANHGQKIQQLPPSASIDVMKAPRGDRDAWQQGRKRKQCGQVVAQGSQNHRGN